MTGRAVNTIVLTLGVAAVASAENVTITISPPTPPAVQSFNMGHARRPDGATLSLDSNSLLLNGKPWTPVMGEFHFSRYPENEWREELLKMKAGGVDIVSTYVFWIHHEEIEGHFDWSGSRDLRRFIQTCQNVGLSAFVRCGPWNHGEVRNGGLPDWLLKKASKPRSNEPGYVEKVKVLYDQIARQLDGLFWRDGGAVIGIQFENEYSGPAEHLLTLKRAGREAGLDAPIYTRTGWNQPSGRMPFGELVPLYGVYAEGFWDRVLKPMPNGYWKGFQFSHFRADDATVQEIPGKGGAIDPPDARLYPYLTCEIGGGMMNSYHRRILIDPKDIESTTLCKLGSGSTLPGYYMYHGGMNPEGVSSTLMESQATGFWNDMPVKNYDFQAPLGQYGQIRGQYHSLRRLHLFLHEWGALLARMPATLPDHRPRGKDDFETLRWSVRSDGMSGFVFVNNYQRLQSMPPKKDVQFVINLPSGPLTFPQNPVTIAPRACFIWPFNLDLGDGVRLSWATVQPLTAVDDGPVRTVFFEATEGVPAQLAFDTNGLPMQAISDHFTYSQSGNSLIEVTPSTAIAARFRLADGHELHIIIVDNKISLALWNGRLKGRDRVFLSQAGLVLEGDSLRLSSDSPGPLSVGIYPPPASLKFEGNEVAPKADGVFQRFTPKVPEPLILTAGFTLIHAAGPPRHIPLGAIQQPVAAAPLDADFDSAAVWQVDLPSGIDLANDPLLRFHYVGDVARLYLNGRFITDDFYNGNPLDLGLRRHASTLTDANLRIAILPLCSNAPIYMGESARPDFTNSPAIAELQSVEVIPRRHVQLTAH